MPPVIAAGLVAVGVGASTAAIAGSVLFYGGLLTLSLLFAPKVPKPEDGRVPFKQSVPPRIRIIGLRRTAGARMLDYATSNGVYYIVQAMCEGEVNEFSRFFFHDDIITIDGSGIVNGLGDDRYGSEQITLYTRNGVNPETAYAPIVSAISPIWTSDHRGDGIASIAMLARDATIEKHPKIFPFGLPVVSAEVDATKVFDPRVSGQDWADPDTWAFAGNDNPILQTMWFLTAPLEQQGMGLDFEECFSDVLVEVGAQATICDEAVALKAGGTEKRYRSGAYYLSTDDPGDVLSAILGTCDGFLCERGDGAWELKAGKWDADDFAIVFEDKHILSLHVRRFRPDEDEVTGVIVKYNSIAHKHTTVDAPVWPRDAYQGGEDKRIRSIEVTYCPSGTQAQRLSKRVATYEMATVTGTMVTKMYGVLVLDRRGATIQCSDDPALADAKVKLMRVEPNLLDGTVEIDFIVFDPDACDAWNAATEEGILASVDVDNPLPDAISTPTAVTAVASQIAGAVYVEISFDPGDVSDDDTGYRVRWRIADIGGGVPGGWSQVTFGSEQVDRQSDDLAIVVMNGLPAADLEFQVQAFDRDSSDWSVTATADTTAPAPGRPTGFTAVLAGANVDVDWISPDSLNFDHARVYRALTGTAFGLATDISGEIIDAPETAQTYLDVAPASGTYDYWVTAENLSDVASLPRGPVTVVVP